MATQKVDFDVLAHDKASDKLDRISRAFRKLKSDSDNIDGDGLVDLSKKLRKVADDFEKEGDRSGKKFGSGLAKWLTGAGANLGKEGGTVFGSGFLGMLKTPVLGPALVAALGATVATVMPAVGAIAGASLVTGFGAGLAGLGIVFASKSVAVKNAWKSTLTAMGADMRVLSQPFEKTLITMAGVAKRTFNGFAPDLESAFRRIAPALTEFGDTLGRAFEELAPAIRPLSEAFTEVLKSLGPATQAAFRNISLGLQDLAKSVKDSPDGLSDLVKGFGDLTRVLLNGITTLNNINGAFERLTGGFSLVDGVMKGLNFAVGSVFGPFALLEQAMGKVGIKANQMNQAVSISADTAKLWTQGLTAQQVAAVNAGVAIAGVTPKAEALAVKFERQWQATQKANEALTRMSGLLLTLSGSQIAYQQAVDDATASIKENGKTHDINTQKGRNNKLALDQVAASAQAQTVAMRNAGDGNVSAAKAAEASRATYIKLARQMGFSATEAKKMAAQFIAIPNVTRTAKLTANKKDLETKLAQAKKELANPNLTKARTAALRADIRNAQRGIATINGMLGNLPRSKTVTLTTVNRFVTERIVRGQSGATGGRLPGFAHGGPVKKGQPIIVGEERPEVFVPDQNGTILPKVPQGLGASPAGSFGGAQRLELVIRADSGSRYALFLAGELRHLLRANGGDVKLMQQLGL